jgi:peroxiredoxin
MSVNDPFVVSAFGEYLGGKHLINYIADGNGEFTKALGFDMDLTPVQLGPVRCKRFSMIVKNNRIIDINSEEGAQMTELSDVRRILE